MESHDVLALLRRTEVLEHVEQEVGSEQDTDRSDRQYQGHYVHDALSEARHQKRDEHHYGEYRRYQRPHRICAKLLHRGLEVMVAHDLRDCLRSLELFLAVGRRDLDVLVEIVQIVLRFCHVSLPLQLERATDMPPRCSSIRKIEFRYAVRSIKHGSLRRTLAIDGDTRLLHGRRLAHTQPFRLPTLALFPMCHAGVCGIVLSITRGGAHGFVG